MARLMDKATVSQLAITREDPARQISISMGKSSKLDHTIMCEGNIIITKQHLKKNRPCITKENVGCDCGWECVSNNKSEMKLKARLHHKVCPLEKK